MRTEIRQDHSIIKLPFNFHSSIVIPQARLFAGRRHGQEHHAAGGGSQVIPIEIVNFILS